MYSSSIGKVCTKHKLRLLWKKVENMFFLDSEHVWMHWRGWGGGVGGVGWGGMPNFLFFFNLLS